jgi:hypothetical protein
MTAAVSNTVVSVDPMADPRWDAMVRDHDGAGVYHLGAWAGVLRAAYGFRPRYLGIEAPDGTLTGGIPAMLTSGPLTGRRLRTLPVVPPAGPLARSDEDMRMLLEAGCRQADAEGAKIWTVHARRGGLERIAAGLEPREKPPTWILTLDREPDELRRGIKKSARNLWRSLKKADDAGVVVREGTGTRDLRAFYLLYARAMRRRRVLPRPFRQISAAAELLPPGVLRLTLAEHGGEVIGGMVGHAFGDTLELLYLGSDEREFERRPNHALYWDAVCWAAANGYTELDFGTAQPGSGLAGFKEQWGARPVEEYRFDYLPGASPGEREIGPRPGAIAEGRESTSLVARSIERAPVRLLAAAGLFVWRL